jgi:hypothetical protein
MNVKDYILDAGDVCYTCWEIEDDCECEEGFDSTRAREASGDFDDRGNDSLPQSVEEIAEQLQAELEGGI